MMEKETSLVSISAEKINNTPINKRLVRLVLESPSVDKKGNSKNSLFFTIRPEWSNFGPRDKALAGGKIESKDYNHSADPNDCSMEEHLKAARIALAREMSEEFSFEIRPNDLEFVAVLDNQQNDLGYINFLFYLNLDKRPELLLKPDNDGIEWILREIIENGGEKLFADHPYLIKVVLAYLTEKQLIPTDQ